MAYDAFLNEFRFKNIWDKNMNMEILFKVFRLTIMVGSCSGNSKELIMMLLLA